MTALQIFTNALEKVNKREYVCAITYVPLQMPAYKEITCTLKSLDGMEVYMMKYRKRFTNDEEKAAAFDKVTEQFIAYVLGG